MADQSAKVVITAQNATAPGIRGVQRDLQGLQKQAQSLTGSLKGMAGALGISVGVSAGITALKSFVTSTIELNDALANTANKTGMTVEELSALQYAAKQADVEFGTLSAALVKFNRGIAEANTGNKSAASAFTQLGISLSTVKALKPDELFLLAAQRISELGSEAERTKAEVDLFGRSGADLDPLFTGGAEGINRAKEAAKELGAVISTDANKKVTELGDKADQLKSKWDAFATNLLGRSAPTIIRALELIEAQLKRPMLENFFRNISGINTAEMLGFNMGGGAGSSSTPYVSESFGPTSRGGKRNRTVRSLVPTGADSEAKKAAEKEAQYWEDIRLKLNAGEQRFYADMNEMAMDYADNTIEQIQRETEARLDAKDTYREWLKEQAKETELLSEIGAQAARNIQDAFAQFLFDPFKGGLKGMLKGFIDMVRQMIAQAASAAILKNFFTWMGGLGGGLGSFGTALLSGLTGKAAGGPVMGNRPYMVGERGPELFVPQTSGSITPNNRLGSGVTVSPVYNIDARGATADLVKSLPAILEANTRRAVELARATIYDDYSRGAFGRA
jgi:hypothetical protein